MASLRKQLHTQTFNYDIQKYPFKQLLGNLFGCDLEDLHRHLGNFEVFERANDQSTLVHKVFYSNYQSILSKTYEDFIKNVIAPIVYPHKFYYQVIPTFRIGLPGNKFVGEYHKDSFYNHQAYEINFNVGLSNFIGDCALRSQVTEDSDDYFLLESPYGTIFSFDHIDCLHGSDINKTDKTMVSFDFRLALQDLYVPSDASSVNMSAQFKPGSYFSKEIIN